jgi:chromosome segregation ATPase
MLTLKIDYSALYKSRTNDINSLTKERDERQETRDFLSRKNARLNYTKGVLEGLSSSLSGLEQPVSQQQVQSIISALISDQTEIMNNEEAAVNDRLAAEETRNQLQSINLNDDSNLPQDTICSLEASVNNIEQTIASNESQIEVYDQEIQQLNQEINQKIAERDTLMQTFQTNLNSKKQQAQTLKNQLDNVTFEIHQSIREGYENFQYNTAALFQGL